MIIVSSQRGGATQLGAHLLNTEENDHVEVYELKGFLSNTLGGAMQEMEAIRKGTRCKQHCFHANYNPPIGIDAPIPVFLDAIDRTEKALGLVGQPKAIVFHEKQGRRHAHVVWSRIDAQQMKAINLPFFKNKVNEIAKEIFLEQNWKLPKGFIDKELRNPLNYSRIEWIQAQSTGEDAKHIKNTLKECWLVSDNKSAFQHALEEKGYYLAKGDRRGYVAMAWHGKVYSLKRWLDIDNKSLEAKLGKLNELKSVQETKDGLDKKLVNQLSSLRQNTITKYEKKLEPLLGFKQTLKERQQLERKQCKDRQAQEWKHASKERQARFATGIRGLWNSLIGKHRNIREQNEWESYQQLQAQRKEMDALIYDQVSERAKLQNSVESVIQDRDRELRELQEAVFSELSGDQLELAQNTLENSQIDVSFSDGPEM